MKTESLKLPYIGIKQTNGLPIIYNKDQSISFLVEIKNSVEEYSTDPDLYDSFHNTFSSIIKICGENYSIQKQDVIFRKEYIPIEQKDYLNASFQNHFKNRFFNKIKTYLTITLHKERNSFFTYDEKSFQDFLDNSKRIYSLLREKDFDPVLLSNKEIDFIFKKFISLDFANKHPTLDNFNVRKEYLEKGKDAIKIFSLIDIEESELPNQLSTYKTKEGKGKGMVEDQLGFLKSIPMINSVIYNQIVYIPNQHKTKLLLETKKTRHSSFPDPANTLAIQDIEAYEEDSQRNNQLIVYSHFNIIINSPKDDISKSENYLKGKLFDNRIIPSNRSFNQLELFLSSLPGNSGTIQNYDKFLTSADAAICLFFKERLLTSNPSNFDFYYTDRNGIPISINPDFSNKGEKLDNRNKFVLGPSGSGKSFKMNHYLRQHLDYNSDVVIIDTGHSYSGLCNYYNGEYITYSENNPITMNPFLLNKEEFTEEKRQMLISLILLLFKNPKEEADSLDSAIISKTIIAYYNHYFEKLEQGLLDQNYLNFNSYYLFSLKEIKILMKKENIPFDYSRYSFLLKRFYIGGQYGETLNKSMDKSFLEKKLIIFEIDAIKDNKVLFPIVTLIIMDIFIQKMRLRTGIRKVLLIEEAWKAIASPLMVEQILFLYKTVRKFYGEAILVTQELDDIIGNDILKNSVINNSDTIILLDQSKFKENFHQIAQLLNLNNIEQNKIFSINKLEKTNTRGYFKEVYIKRGDKGEVYGVEVSLEEYFTYTTEAPEKRAIQKYIDKYHNQEKALQHFIEDLKQSGLNNDDFVLKINKKKDDYEEIL